MKLFHNGIMLLLRLFSFRQLQLIYVEQFFSWISLLISTQSEKKMFFVTNQGLTSTKKYIHEIGLQLASICRPNLLVTHRVTLLVEQNL